MDLGLGAASVPTYEGRTPTQQELATYREDPEKLSHKARQEVRDYLNHQNYGGGDFM